MKKTSVQKKIYKSPKIKVYGGLAKLTANGSGTGQENTAGNDMCSNNPGLKC